MNAGFDIYVEIKRTGEMPEHLKNGQLVELLKRIKQQITVANNAVKQAKVDQTLVENLLRERMEQEEVDRFAGTEGGTAYIKEEEVAQLTDFEALGQFCAETGNWQLFQRRINNAAYREILEQTGEDVPGLTTFTTRKVATR